MFVADLLSHMPARVPGTAVFMSGNPVGTPPALRHNVRHNKVLHERVVILSVETAEMPHVERDARVVIEEVGEGFWTIVLRYGFMQEPDVPKALAAIQHPQLNFADDEISYFLGRETLRPADKPGMPHWRERLFVLMARNAQTATPLLPPREQSQLHLPLRGWSWKDIVRPKLELVIRAAFFQFRVLNCPRIYADGR
jgi:KUP system potassium uptake protein